MLIDLDIKNTAHIYIREYNPHWSRVWNLWEKTIWEETHYVAPVYWPTLLVLFTNR